MAKSNFILYLVKNRVENFIFVLGFISAVIGYTLWHPLGVLLNMSEEQSYSIFYICISIAFFFYTFAYYLTKYNKWRWFPMFVYLVCLSRVFVEFSPYEDKQTHDLVEYGMFVLTMFIVITYYLKWRYKKYKDEGNTGIDVD
ncbi:MAG: hypothetical protein KUG64_11200 [Cycloclasticus sp.]|nr:hypothetical protein [Cycloclasticus sp.]